LQATPPFLFIIKFSGLLTLVTQGFTYFDHSTYLPKE
jgi:hypothetical protein